MNIQTLLLISMIFIIWFAHINWLQEPSGKLFKLVIFGSFLLFALIFVEHSYHASKNVIKSELTEKDLERFASNDIFSKDNMASKLVHRLLCHPIFYCF